MDRNEVYKYFQDKKEMEGLCIRYISSFYAPTDYCHVELKDFEYRDGGIIHISANVYKNAEPVKLVLHSVSVDTLCGDSDA